MQTHACICICWSKYTTNITEHSYMTSSKFGLFAPPPPHPSVPYCHKTNTSPLICVTSFMSVPLVMSDLQPLSVVLRVLLRIYFFPLWNSVPLLDIVHHSKGLRIQEHRIANLKRKIVYFNRKLSKKILSTSSPISPSFQGDPKNFHKVIFLTLVFLLE